MNSISFETCDVGSVTHWSEKEQKCLKEFKQLIERDPLIKDFMELFDDLFLFSFIKGKKFDIAVAHKTLYNYIHTRRHKYSYLFKTLLPSTTASLDQGIVRKLKNNDPFNRIVVVIRFWLWNPKEISQPDTLQLFALLMDDYLQNQCHESNGFVAIFDMTGYTLEHAKVLTPTQAFIFLNLVWRNLPIRFKALHIYNEIWLFKMLLKTVRPFLPKKVRDRIYIHSTNLRLLHDIVPQEILPKSLGGHLEENEAFDDAVEERIHAREDYYEKFSNKL